MKRYFLTEDNLLCQAWSRTEATVINGMWDFTFVTLPHDVIRMNYKTHTGSSHPLRQNIIWFGDHLPLGDYNKQIDAIRESLRPLWPDNNEFTVIR